MKTTDLIFTLRTQLNQLADLFEYSIATPGYGSDENSREEALDHLASARAAIAQADQIVDVDAISAVTDRFYIALGEDESIIYASGHSYAAAVDAAVAASGMTSNLRAENGMEPFVDEHGDETIHVFGARQCTRRLFDFVKVAGGKDVSWFVSRRTGLADILDETSDTSAPSSMSYPPAED